MIHAIEHALAFYKDAIAPWIYTVGSICAFWIALRTLKHEQKHADEMFSILENLGSAQTEHIDVVGEALRSHKQEIERLQRAEHEMKKVIMLGDAPRLLKALQDAGRQHEKETKPN